MRAQSCSIPFENAMLRARHSHRPTTAESIGTIARRRRANASCRAAVALTPMSQAVIREPRLARPRAATTADAMSGSVASAISPRLTPATRPVACSRPISQLTKTTTPVAIAARIWTQAGPGRWTPARFAIAAANASTSADAAPSATMPPRSSASLWRSWTRSATITGAGALSTTTPTPAAVVRTT